MSWYGRIEAEPLQQHGRHRERGDDQGLELSQAALRAGVVSLRLLIEGVNQRGLIDETLLDHHRAYFSFGALSLLQLKRLF